jgi:hypothetical protein
MSILSKLDIYWHIISQSFKPSSDKLNMSIGMQICSGKQIIKNVSAFKFHYGRIFEMSLGKMTFGSNVEAPNRPVNAPNEMIFCSCDSDEGNDK